jgi:rSAM/selenodomain-associated transferase 2
VPLRLAVIVPVLDEAPAIAATLQALAPLRQRGAVVVVADGGSRDGTADLAAPWVDAVVQAPRGRARQMNAGAQAAVAAPADVLLFLHADTRLPPDADRLVQQALSDATRHWGRFDVRIEGRSALLPVVATLMNLRSRLTGIATGDQAMFVRASVFRQLAGFPDQPLMEDVELSRRLKRLGPPCCLQQRVVTSGRRWDQRGAWRTVLLMWRLRWLYWLGASPERLARLYR